MSGSQVKPWDQFCDFCAESTRIFKAFSMALDAKKLAFAFAGVVVWGLGAMLINVLALKLPWAIPVAAGIVAAAFIFIAFARSEGDMASKKFLLGLLGSLLAVALVVVVLILVERARDGHPALLINIYRIAWTLAVAAFFGTAVARIAALDAATEDSIGPRETARFAMKKLSTSAWTLLAPVVAVLAFGLVLLLVGLPGRIPAVGYVWYILMGALYIIALLGGLFFAVVLLAYVPGLVLFQPAIAAEGNDAFDALSMAYSFVFSKPWRLLFYGIIGFIYTRIVLTIAGLAFVLAGKITNTFLAKGVGARMASSAGRLDLRGVIFGGGDATIHAGPFFNAGGHVLRGNVYQSFTAAGEPGGWLIVFWQYILLAIFLAFALSLIYSVFTQIYFLMRKACEGTPFDEVYIETPEEEEYAAQFEDDEKKTGETEKPSEETAEEKPEEKSVPQEKKRPKKQNDTEEPIDLAGEKDENGKGAEENKGK